MNNTIIYKNERIDDLHLNNLKLIQNPKQFCFGVDAVLLAHFASAGIKSGSKTMDMCAGNGIISILLSHKSLAEEIVGLEIQNNVSDMASRSVILNDLSKKIKMVCGDLKNAGDMFGKSSFNNIVCNPPYKEYGGGLVSRHNSTAIARHEILCNAEDIIKSSSELLMPGGKLAMIHRPERLIDLVTLMRSYKIEPKRLRFVHPSYKKTATMILLEGTYGGRPKLFLEPPLYIYEETGTKYTDEINLIYERESESKDKNKGDNHEG